MRTLWRLLVVSLVIVAAPAAAQQFVVPPLARVVDQANVLSPATREQLTRLLAEHERQSSNQVVVVTLATLGGLDIADAGLRLGREWRLGTKQHNNGALLVVVPSERRLRIEVGYGLEGTLPDARANQIINTEIVPRFRAGDFEGGIVKGTVAIIAAIEGSYQPPRESATKQLLIMWPLFFVGAVILIALYANYRLGGFSGDRRGVRGFLGSIRTSSSSGGGGSWSGGGGSFGGGGASGRW
ncbi:MAG: TPM domain-containing protein [Alphaproteobacteria bacterium]|nr:TPM domain-containing protein [Alphaproteobacteria bacterium]